MAAHFHDYSPAAMRLWLAVAAAGAIALLASLAALSQAEPSRQWQTLAGLGLVALAAWFPVQIPRTKYSVGAADVFVFTLLAVLGPAAAVLAAGLEGVIGACRGTRRLSSRISTPATGMASMGLCGLAFGALSSWLSGRGLDPAVARAAALLPSAAIPFVLGTLTLTAMVTLKRHRWPDLGDWFGSFAWLGAVYLAAALVAGIVQILGGLHGGAVFAIVGVATLGVVLLLRVSIAHHEAEHRAQEIRISQAQHEAEINQQRFAAAFTHAAIGMAIVDVEGCVVRANEPLCQLLGRSEAALLGRRFALVLNASDAELLERRSREVAEQPDAPSFSIELRCTASDGREWWVALHCGRFQDPSSSRPGLIYQLHDITSRQIAEARLQHIAYHDSLTDLPNRACFHEQLELAVEASRVDPGLRFAVVFIDLDRFKVVNDSLGHLCGNELLCEVARRLQNCLRPGELVARLGGDEFAILIRGLRDHADGMHLAERLLAALARPVSIGGTEIVPAASIGLTFSDLGYRTVDELLRDADLAMYEAKSAGRGRFAVFDRSMHERVADRLALEADLRRAIGDGELSLTFQPLYDLDPYRLSGFEALARWVHPVRGPVSPAVFIGLAEESGHIEALTAWVLEKSIEHLASWHRGAPHMRHLGVNVNISGRDLARPGFVDTVLRILQAHRVPTNLLTLEVTETVLMTHLDAARGVMARLHACGVQLAIDDFGTGYSSLAYLSTLPINCLKIDRSFVAAMERRHEDVEIVRAVLSVWRVLAQRVVAEGIETAEQLLQLRRLGVHAGQGYLLSRPVRPEQVPALIYSPTEQPA